MRDIQSLYMECDYLYSKNSSKVLADKSEYIEEHEDPADYVRIGALKAVKLA